jgi:hypothetical protein
MCSVSVYDPRLYLHLNLSIERRYMDNPPRHSCLPVVYFFCLKLGRVKGSGKCGGASIPFGNMRKIFSSHKI